MDFAFAGFHCAEVALRVDDLAGELEAALGPGFGLGEAADGVYRFEAGFVIQQRQQSAAVAVAESSGHVVVAVGVYPDADTLADDAERAKARKEAGVTAQLFERLPIRNWDHYLGPRERRFYLLAPNADSVTGFGEPREIARGTMVHPEASFDITPDGSTFVYDRPHGDDATDLIVEVVAVDLASGDERVLTPPDALYRVVGIDHAGRRVACVRLEVSPDDARDATVWLIDLASGDGRDALPDFDRLPGELAWSHDDETIVLVADEAGHRPVFVADVATGDVRRVTGDGAFMNVRPAPDGNWAFGLESAIDRPAAPVRISLADGSVERLKSPGSSVELPGTIHDIEATADDGQVIRSWVALPDGADADHPAPLIVWVHGGPVASWNDWSWRWNPWLLVERGYAVLMPDPALSTGYGRDFLRRGHAAWGHRPYTDVMAAVDGAVARADIDADRTGLMGGSFGGYMANWIAGHTDRFRCIVTHASIWALDQFQGTTDMPPFWAIEWGSVEDEPERYATHSPHHHAHAITTPMLVIHGELDHRVPIGEGLRLWSDLQRHGVASKFLYFPDENHWILKPQNARVWYDTVFAWLAQYVLGEEWQQPELL